MVYKDAVGSASDQWEFTTMKGRTRNAHDFTFVSLIEAQTSLHKNKIAYQMSHV